MEGKREKEGVLRIGLMEEGRGNRGELSVREGHVVIQSGFLSIKSTAEIT